jgi:putative endonuclease
MHTREVGARAEALAARFLEASGYRIVHRNYLIKAGEIDLVAHAPDGTLCFVEVRLRADAGFGAPQETVGAEKQRRVIAAARHYLATRVRGEPPCRFDVIAITAKDDKASVEHIADAFRLE